MSFKGRIFFSKHVFHCFFTILYRGMKINNTELHCDCFFVGVGRGNTHMEDFEK
jgi:hypothetical protein